MSTWFRLYTDVLNSPKVQRLTPELFKAWINLLCLAKEHDGLLPSTEDIAFRLRMSDADAKCLVEELAKRGLLDRTENGLTPHNWEDRQFLSDEDPTAAIRARRHRLSKRNVTDASRVTSQTSHTPQSRDRAETDSESEQSRGGSGETPSPASPAKPRSASRRPQVCDDEYLAELQANPAYAMFDVRRLYLKMVEWCRLKGKQPTRGRLVNWLNKEDVLMNTNSTPPKNKAAYVGESPPPKETFDRTKANNEMAELIEDWIAYEWIDLLKNEYDGIIKRGGAKVEWEIRCVAWYELHKQTMGVL